MWHRIDDPDNPPPKDGTLILLLPYGELEDLFVSYWDSRDERWANNEWSNITHWAHMPPPPAEDTP